MKVKSKGTSPNILLWPHVYLVVVDIVPICIAQIGIREVAALQPATGESENGPPLQSIVRIKLGRPTSTN
jgi:hypothetical protein